MLPSLARRYSSKTRPKAPRKLAAVQSAHVRLWDTVKIRDVAHLVQAIEQKYGKILEFKCGRDYELKSKFQSLMFVTFANPQSLRSMAADGDILRITVPHSEEEPPGGAGLNDVLSSLPLLSQISNASKSTPDSPQHSGNHHHTLDSHDDPTRVLSCRISPARFNHYTLPSSRKQPLGPAQIQSLGREFLSWAGFHTPFKEPPTKSQTQKYQPHTPMEKSLLKWSKLSGRPMPGRALVSTSLPSDETITFGLRNSSRRRATPEWQALPPTAKLPPGRNSGLVDPNGVPDDPIFGLADAFASMDAANDEPTPEDPSRTFTEDEPLGYPPIPVADTQKPTDTQEPEKDSKRKRLQTLIGDL